MLADNGVLKKVVAEFAARLRDVAIGQFRAGGGRRSSKPSGPPRVNRPGRCNDSRTTRTNFPITSSAFIRDRDDRQGWRTARNPLCAAECRQSKTQLTKAPMDSNLGECEHKSGINREHWKQVLTICGLLIGSGPFGLAMAWFLLDPNDPLYWPCMWGLLLTVIGVLLLFRERPQVLSVEVCADGLRVNERRGTTSLSWSNISRIEESYYRGAKTTVRLVSIESYLAPPRMLNNLMLESFDVFVEALRRKAEESNVEWKQSGDGDGRRETARS